MLMTTNTSEDTMKHTRISLEDTASRFLFAAEHHIPEIIASMTNELADARQQCQQITGMTWIDFTNMTQDKIHAN